MFVACLILIVFGLACWVRVAVVLGDPDRPAIEAALPAAIWGAILFVSGIVTGLAGVLLRWVGA